MTPPAVTTDPTKPDGGLVAEVAWIAAKLLQRVRSEAALD
jgi:hypothetical protein